VITYITVAYVSLVYIATQAAPRYSIPLRPELYLSASFSLYYLAGWVKQKRKEAQLSEQ
jgi:hypothetical protein